jgi:hypothetical protein
LFLFDSRDRTCSSGCADAISDRCDRIFIIVLGEGRGGKRLVMQH